MKLPDINTRMPYMMFNWANHSARTCRLTLEERGMFDAVRCELWAVVGCRLPLALLKTRLRVLSGSREEHLIDSLIAFGLLRVDEESRVYDEIQVLEFQGAVAKAEINSINGKKGGRPRKASPEGAPRGADSGDF